MEKKSTIYYELNELISTVNDVEFLYEIKQQIEEHKEAETKEVEEEWTDEQLAKLNKHNDGEPITSENFVTLAEYKKIHEFEEDLFGDKDWVDALSEEQKADLESSIEESYDEKNLISWEEYQKLTARWREA